MPAEIRYCLQINRKITLASAGFACPPWHSVLHDRTFLDCITDIFCHRCLTKICYFGRFLSWMAAPFKAGCFGLTSLSIQFTVSFQLDRGFGTAVVIPRVPGKGRFSSFTQKL